MTVFFGKDIRIGKNMGFNDTDEEFENVVDCYTFVVVLRYVCSSSSNSDTFTRV